MAYVAGNQKVVCRRAGVSGYIALLASLLIFTGNCFAAEAGSLESRVKAAFIYKFVDYVEWPETAFVQPGTPVMIAVIGADAVADELARVAEGRKVNERAVIVKRLRAGEPLTGVHILFVGGGAVAQLAPLLQAARPLSILTVTEAEGVLAQGSVINFIVVDRRVRFEISRDSANKNKLRLSSRLLAVAQHVVEGP